MGRTGGGTREDPNKMDLENWKAIGKSTVLRGLRHLRKTTGFSRRPSRC